ncbi:sickle tail protein [Hippocampus zosterae]|uniref:sickle tail protein n=1 Tax=Hippocampus zosterae TaxID=109293 RepID=UPI00223DF8AE|nr:sickle tail protein [Hippocampus zosterae]
MSKTSARSGRPGSSAGSHPPDLKKDLQGNRSCMLRIGERLMRAGSEGNLVPRPCQSQNQNPSRTSASGREADGATKADGEDKAAEHADTSRREGPSPSIAPSSCRKTEHRLPKKDHATANLLCNSDGMPHSASTLPRSRGAAGTDGDPPQGLRTQRSQAERNKEAFLDHLRRKYPHHAAIVLGQQEPAKDSLGSPRPPDSALCEEGAVAAGKMSDGELLLTVPFARGTKARSSLPIGRSSSQAGESVGVLYLQYGDQTKQIGMPAEISSEETLRALFVAAFPQQLTMKKLQSPNMAIYIKDTRRNVYFDLEDIRNITSHSCLKVYHKDPSHVFNHPTGATNAEGRISKEVLYGSHSPVHRLSSSSRGPLHGLQGSMSPPTVRSMPSSPSRVAYGGRRSQGSLARTDAGNADRLTCAGRSSSLCTSSSAILERRDVKPDEDGGSCQSVALVVHGEGGARHPDIYRCASLQDGGRSAFASSRCSGSLSRASEMGDGGVGVIPGGLPQFRASIKPLMGYGDIMERHAQSPHRLHEVGMNEGQIIGGVGLISPERMSPIRRSLRRESSGASVEMVNRSRGSASSSSTSSVFLDSPLRHPEMLIPGPRTAFDAQSERLKAMEEQIASLAELVHHALSVGGNNPRDKDLISGSVGKSHQVPSEVPSAADELIGSASRTLQAPTAESGLQRRLVQVKSSVSELRLQLNQLRHLQMAHQQTMKSMLRMAGQELLLLLSDRPVSSEEGPRGRRAEIDEERIDYLDAEEKILRQLSDLEAYVSRLQGTPVSLSGQLPITLSDVEEGAVNLRRVGETLAVLKGDFPELQAKMRYVLRLEMDAVRFLKEEPHKMDSMLKRVKALTEALGSLRRCVSESSSPTKGAQVESPKVSEADRGAPLTRNPWSSPQPQPRSSVGGPQSVPSSAFAQPELSDAASASPAAERRVKTTQAAGIQTHRRSSSVPEGTRWTHAASQVQSSGKPTAKPLENTQGESREGRRSPDASSEARANPTDSVPHPDGSDPNAAHSDLASGDIRPRPRKPDAEPPADPLPARPEPPPPASQLAKRPPMEKPRRASVEKKQSPDRSGQSSPALPRRCHAATVGLTAAARTGEPVSTSSKGEKEASGIPQAKPPRRPPEVKAKALGTTPATASENADEEKEDNDTFPKEPPTSGACTRRTHSGFRHSSGSPEKTTKGQREASPERARQADKSGTKAAGESTRSVVALRPSQTQAALRHLKSGRQPRSCASLSTPRCSDGLHSVSPSLLWSSPSKSSANASALSVPSCTGESGRARPRPPPSCRSSGRKNSSGSPHCSSWLPRALPPHKSLIPSLNLSRLLPSSSKVWSASLASGNPSLARRGSGSGGIPLAGAAAAQLTCSSSSSSSSSSATSVSPASSSPSALSPSSSFHHPSSGPRPAAPARRKKGSRTQRTQGDAGQGKDERKLPSFPLPQP